MKGWLDFSWKLYKFYKNFIGAVSKKLCILIELIGLENLIRILDIFVVPWKGNKIK